MDTELYQTVLYYINLILSILNNLFVLVGLVFTIRKLVKIARKRRYIRKLGQLYGYETCQWKYIEKQLRMSLLLVLLVIELLYLVLYNARTVIQSADSGRVAKSPFKNYSSDCILRNGTFLAHEYDFNIPVVALRIMRSLQKGLFIYGLWISYIFLSHLIKAMNKLVERKKLVFYSLIGGIAPIVLIIISNIPVMSIFKVLITVIISQVALACAILQAIKFLTLVKKENASLQYSYTYNSQFMTYRRWLLKQYIIVTISLTTLLEIYILRDLASTGYMIGESIDKNPCWFQNILNIQLPVPNLVNRGSVENAYLLSKLVSRMLNIIFHAGLFSIQIYIVVCYYYKLQKKKAKSGLKMKNTYLSDSLLFESKHADLQY